MILTQYICELIWVLECFLSATFSFVIWGYAYYLSCHNTFYVLSKQVFFLFRALHLPKWRLRQRKPRQTLLSTFFLKRQHELKTLNVFFESAFEDLSFHSFLKASDWDFEGKNGCNKHRIWFIEHNFDCSLRPKYCLENVKNSISKHLNFKIAAYFPSGDVYFKSYWQHCRTLFKETKKSVKKANAKIKGMSSHKVIT